MIQTPEQTQPADGAIQPAAGAIQPAEMVQQMFDDIAPRYDILNHLLSSGIDRTWWWRTARRFRPILQNPEARIVDLCCGTGDMTMALQKHRPKPISTGFLMALDFSHQMLSLGYKKFPDNVLAIEADALHLPLADNSLHLISSAFGFRNLISYEAGLAEIFRVLRPGGQVGILDCNQPSGPVGILYNLYFKKILPRVGARLSNAAAYKYLPASVERFPRPPRMLQLFRQAGFIDATWTSYTFGIAGLYIATKPTP